jgi:hypothetical protein
MLDAHASVLMQNCLEKSARVRTGVVWLVSIVQNLSVLEWSRERINVSKNLPMVLQLCHNFSQTSYSNP